MIANLGPGESLVAVMAAVAATTNPTFKSQYTDGAGNLEKTGRLNGTTEVEVVPAPKSGTRQVNELLVFNADSAAVTVTVSKKIRTSTFPFSKATLQINDTQAFREASGAIIADSNGQQRVTTNGQRMQIATRAKVGSVAGWVIAAADNLPYVATLPASQTGAKLIIPLHGLFIGDTITGFKINAQVESGGNTVTIDADLRAVTNVAAEPTDASIGTMTQVSVAVDSAVGQEKTGLSEVVASGKSYYLVITATTAASTDIIMQFPEVTLTLST